MGHFFLLLEAPGTQSIGVKQDTGDYCVDESGGGGKKKEIWAPNKKEPLVEARECLLCLGGDTFASPIPAWEPRREQEKKPSPSSPEVCYPAGGRAPRQAALSHSTG